MKMLYDGSEIPARVWYYVLDWAQFKGYENIPVLDNKSGLRSL
jgi:hypothetical protein